MFSLHKFCARRFSSQNEKGEEEKHDKEALLILLCCCVSWLWRAITHTVNLRVSQEITRGQKWKMSPFILTHDMQWCGNAGSRKSVGLSKWLQFAWAQSDYCHLSQTVVLADQWNGFLLLSELAKSTLKAQLAWGHYLRLLVWQLQSRKHTQCVRGVLPSWIFMDFLAVLWMWFSSSAHYSIWSMSRGSHPSILWQFLEIKACK